MLTAKTIKTLTKQRTLDAHGLYFCVSPSGARKWTYRYRHQGRSREMGLGGYPDVSLQQARIKRDAQRALRNEGLDPLEEKQRQARRKLAAGEQTFARAAAFAYDVKREELTNLKSLVIGGFGSQITDAGLVNLKGMTKVEELLLFCPKVTDAGLVHLTGLTNLQTLNLVGTKVTDAGVADLQKALPNCIISK